MIQWQVPLNFQVRLPKGKMVAQQNKSINRQTHTGATKVELGKIHRK
jgi:hypothetical protein